MSALECWVGDCAFDRVEGSSNCELHDGKGPSPVVVYTYAWGKPDQRRPHRPADVCAAGGGRGAASVSVLVWPVASDEHGSPHGTQGEQEAGRVTLFVVSEEAVPVEELRAPQSIPARSSGSSSAASRARKARPFHLEHAREIIRACSDGCHLCAQAMPRELIGGGESHGYPPIWWHDDGHVSYACTAHGQRGPAVFVKQLGAKPTYLEGGDAEKTLGVEAPAGVGAVRAEAAVDDELNFDPPLRPEPPVVEDGAAS